MTYCLVEIKTFELVRGQFNSFHELSAVKGRHMNTLKPIERAVFGGKARINDI
jgi:hypothetical protein